MLSCLMLRLRFQPEDLLSLLTASSVDRIRGACSRVVTPQASDVTMFALFDASQEAMPVEFNFISDMAAIVKGSTVRIKRKESYWYNETGIVASREKEPTKSRYPITVRFEKGNYYGLQGIDGGNNTNNFHEDELELVES